MMNNQTEKRVINDSEAGDSAVAVGRPYHQPRLTNLGAIQELVQGGSSGPLSDAGKPSDASIS